MATAGLTDFCRKRKLVITVILALVCALALFIHFRSFRHPRSTESRAAASAAAVPAPGPAAAPKKPADPKKPAGAGIPNKDIQEHAKPLPPMFNRFRNRKKPAGMIKAGDKVWKGVDIDDKDDDNNWPFEEKAVLDQDSPKKDDFGDTDISMGREKEGGVMEGDKVGGVREEGRKEDLDRLRNGEIGGEAPLDKDLEKVKLEPESGLPDQQAIQKAVDETEVEPAKPIPEQNGKQDLPDPEPFQRPEPNQHVRPDQYERVRGSDQNQNQYPQQNRYGNSDDNLWNQNRYSQSQNQFPQPGMQNQNQPQPPDTGNQNRQWIQPGAQPNQQPPYPRVNPQVNPPYPGANQDNPVPYPLNRQRINPESIPPNPPNNPPNPPLPGSNPPNRPPLPPIAPNQQSSSLYVPSTMPLGRPLDSHKTPRQEAVVNAFRHAWKAYKDYAWGKDEVNPVSHTSSSSFFDMGMTLVDCLDTLWLMGLGEEFQEARDWVEQSLDVEHKQKTVSLFETNIRVLGGLLSAYHLSEDPMFLDKAVKLGTKLLPAFSTPSGVPSNTVSLSNGAHTGRSITVAEAGSLQLEFRDLTRASGNPSFQEVVDRTMQKILSQSPGIVRQTLNTGSGQFSGSLYSVGGGTDSYYEYLLKQWIQSGRIEDKFRQAYEHSVKDITTHLVGYSQPSHMAYVGNKYNLGAQPPSPSMQHLTCFYPGTLALGVIYELQPSQQDLAANLTHTCYYMYNSTVPTGLAPESFSFNIDPRRSSDATHSSSEQNLQRPETVESLFYMYRLTKDNRYREWGWQIFQAFEKYTKIEAGGYASLNNVHKPGSYRDRMESFFLTETLKYLYLLFEDDDNVVSLKEWVFNTEAHPLPIWRT